MMSSPAEQQIASCLKQRSGIVAAYLFGSGARGERSALSDIDVAILWEEVPAESLRVRARLIEELSRATGITADVVFLNDGPPALAGRVLREGTLLFCRDDTERIRYEIRALQRDLDTIQLRKLFDQSMSRAIREGRFYG
jgi:predicted nucleotidyltransferase